MIVAALVTFAVLLAVWILAPSGRMLTVVEPMAGPVEPVLAEAA
jgi:hypothetical protein